MNKLCKFAAACAAVLCAFGAVAGSLPAEYQEVSYVDSTGAEWIDTGVVINENHELQFKVAALTLSQYRGPFGTYTSESANATRLCVSNGSKTSWLVNFMTKAGGGGTTFAGVTSAAGDTVEGWMRIDRAKLNSVEQDLGRDESKIGTEDASTLKLFGRSGYLTKMRIFYFRILEGGEVKHNYVPCYRYDVSGEVGLYDTVEGRFLGNDSGAGALVAGGTVDYIWTGAAGDGKWMTGGNWSVGGEVPQSGPCHVCDKAVFPESAVGTITCDCSVSVGGIDIAAANLDLVFTSEADVTVTAASLICGGGEKVAPRVSSVTLDGVNLTVTGGTVTFIPGQRLELRNGSDVSLPSLSFYNRTDKRSDVVLSGDSALTVRGDLTICCYTFFTLDDSTVTCNGNFNIDFADNTHAVGGGHFIFKGTHPLLTGKGDTFTTKGTANGAGSDFDFFIPADGYENVPIQYTGRGKFMVPVKNNPAAQRFNVISSSPCVRKGQPFTQTLVSLTTQTTEATLAKPTVGDATWQAFDWNADRTALVYTQYDPAGTLLVSGEPFDVPGPDYSPVLGLSKGDARTLTAPEHPADSDEATCTGYRLYDIAADGTRTEVDGSPFSGTTCDYVHGTTRRALVWQWNMPEETVEATGTALEDGAALQEALDAHKYAKISVGPGDYRLSGRAFHIRNAVLLRGTASDPYLTKMQVATSTGYEYAVVVSNALAKVENLLFSNLSSKNGRSAGAVRLWAGTVDHCIASNSANATSGYLNVPGGGFCMEGGTVRNSLAIDCQHDRAEGGGFGLRKAGCLVENCRAIRCNSEGYDSARGGGIAAFAGTVRNCLVANCRSQASGFGIYLGGSVTVENCTVVDCTTKKSAGGSGIEIASGAATVRNTIAWGNKNVNGISDIALNSVRGIVEACDSVPQFDVRLGNVSTDPGFTDPASGDYTIGFSACVDGGVYQGWMNSICDLAGGNRVKGPEPDMGCYERDVSDELNCSFVYETSGGVDSGEISLVATVDGAKGKPVYNWYAIGQDGTTNATLRGEEYAEATLTLPPAHYSIALKVEDGDRSAESVQRGIFSVLASTVYANASGAGRVPYATEADGAPDIGTAFDMVADGGTLYVADGTYAVSNRIYMQSGRSVRIVSLNGPERVTLKSSSGGDLRANGFKMIELRSAKAALCGLTLVGFSSTDYGLVTLANSGAVVTNCVLRDAKGRYNTSGIAVTMSAGTLVDTVVCGASGDNSGGGCGSGSALSMTDGTVERCVFTNNVHTGVGLAETSGGAVAVSGGTVRNSLFADNECRSTSSIYVGGSATFDNCSIVGNRTGVTASETYRRTGFTVAGDAVVRNCLIADNTNVACGETNVTVTSSVPLDHCLVSTPDIAAEGGIIIARPKFNRKAGDWRLRSSSPGVDQGKVLDWMGGAADLKGAPRIQGVAPDIGCHEDFVHGLMLIVR